LTLISLLGIMTGSNRNSNTNLHVKCCTLKGEANRMM
jgi:hypothetical protein